ncbi:MAG: sll0787 family AIR synthase-like protein [Pseudomonadota bacterium]
MTALQTLADSLRSHPTIQGKRAIGDAARQLNIRACSSGKPGDDTAVLENGRGWDLLAGEGFIPRFVIDDPWFAGWCGVMVNVSDIAAMGGRPVAIVDQVWAPAAECAEVLMSGMRDASECYQVPIVGGHTNYDAFELNLAVSVFGRATALITSFDAEPGDVLIAAVDHRGSYRNSFDNFFAAGGAPAERLRGDLELLPELSEAGLVKAGKDISQSGIVGTALMLAECSSVSITIDLDAIERPDGALLEPWLRSFPSFGFILAVKPDDVAAVVSRFHDRNLAASAIGDITEGSTLHLKSGDETVLFWDYASQPYLNLQSRVPTHA